MSNLMQSLYNIRFFDDAARKNTFIHDLHPLAKLLATFAYLVVLASFDQYDVSGMLPLFFYPVLLFALGEIPVGPVFKRLLMVEPLVVGIGLLNPIMDLSLIQAGPLILSRGWFTFISILIKCSLAVLAALLLISTTGIEKIASALRMLKVPRLFVLQFLLTFRYITVLMEEVTRILRAYSMRAPGQKGIHIKSWGSLAGQLLLRTFDRAERIYQAMCLRGFNGEYYLGRPNRMTSGDILYAAIWILVFTAARLWDLPALIGSILTGGIK